MPADPHEPDLERGLTETVSPRSYCEEPDGMVSRQPDLSTHDYSRRAAGYRARGVDRDGDAELRLGRRYEYDSERRDDCE
jgi:hypothetical protein